MRVAEQQCIVKNHNCQIMYPEQRHYSHHTCFCQKNFKMAFKNSQSQAASLSTRILYFLIKCTSSQWVTLL